MLLIAELIWFHTVLIDAGLQSVALNSVPDPAETQAREAGTFVSPVNVALMLTVPGALHVANPPVEMVTSEVLELPQFVQL